MKFLKYSLKSTSAWNSLISGKLSFYQANYLIQSTVSSLNSRPLAIIDNIIISPTYIQTLVLQKAYDDDIIERLPFISQIEKKQGVHIPS